MTTIGYVNALCVNLVRDEDGNFLLSPVDAPEGMGMYIGFESCPGATLRDAMAEITAMVNDPRELLISAVTRAASEYYVATGRELDLSALKDGAQ